MKRLLCLVTGLALLVASGALAADAVKIGLMGPMTGSWASEGQEMKQVVGLLADELNQQGGVLGRKVEIISEDDAGDPRQASLAANRLATQGIVAVIGTYGSSITEAAQNIYDEAGIVQVANGSTAIRLSEKGLANFFRTCPRDDEQGKVATATIGKLGYKKVAILHDNTSYAKGLAEEAQANLKGMNIPVVFFDALTPGERADVVKIEPPGGDFVRETPPFHESDDSFGGYFQSVNRGKRSLELDFNDESDREDFRSLVEEADVVVERVLAEALQKHPTRLLAYCLMPNHVHLVLVPSTLATRAVIEPLPLRIW